MRTLISAALAALLAGAPVTTTVAAVPSTPIVADPPLVQVQRKTCKQVDSCEEAVQIWCDGYTRADADKDGIPCENICRSKEQVDEIRQSIGC